jgi:proliferating cell nuclear antigen
MFEATLTQVVVLRKIVESLKDLVTEVNLEATPTGKKNNFNSISYIGLSLQAMDSAHVSLVSLQLNESGFEQFRCDKAITLGINLTDFSKILKMAQNDDIVTLKADDENSFLNIIFDNKSKRNFFNSTSNRKRKNC